ncbi:hypothetical protein E2320_011876, partial [Naja naja]
PSQDIIKFIGKLRDLYLVSYAVCSLQSFLPPPRVFSDIQLVESGPGMARPGNQLSLVSPLLFFIFPWNWIKQPPGKGIEWLSAINANSGGKWLANSVKGCATISADHSRNEFSLWLNSVTAADSSVYICARQHTPRQHLFGLCGLSQVVLTQSDPVLKKPGESHKLTCAVTGFNVNSYSMYWVRQKPGQGLEWIVYYYSSSDNSYSPTIQGRFIASKDSSNFYLQMNNLKGEDTAVYYCARSTDYILLLVYYYSSNSNYYSPTIQGWFTASKDSSNFYLQINNLKAEDTDVQLVETGGGVVFPEVSLHLKCKASGYNFTIHEIHWIQQTPGKELEWVAGINQPKGTSQWYNSKVEGRFSVSRDNSQISPYLQMNNLKPEDSALYYCARRHSDFLFVQLLCVSLRGEVKSKKENYLAHIVLIESNSGGEEIRRSP